MEKYYNEWNIIRSGVLKLKHLQCWIISVFTLLSTHFGMLFINSIKLKKNITAQNVVDIQYTV